MAKLGSSIYNTALALCSKCSKLNKNSDRKNKNGEVKILDLLHSIGADLEDTSRLEKEVS